jgi:P-type Ca2+ transporter type 2C
MTAADDALLTGLTEMQAQERLSEDGFNELPASKKRRAWHFLWNVVREPMFLLLLACGSLYLLLGDLVEAFLLLGFVFVIMAITFYQEQKTERALEALRDLSSPRALVIRDGRRQRIPGRDVVRDDLVVVSEGDRIPADSLLLSSQNVHVDESLLTGESVPVRKKNWDGLQPMTRPGGDDLPFVYSGTLVVKGRGIARVVSTGVRTEMGRIGKALQVLEPEETTLQKETGRIVRNVALLGLGLCVLVAVGFGLARGNWLNGILAGLTLAMATLPEEFPVVLTVFLALGAWRISKRHVLTRRIPAVEMLGAVTALCVDKTGTLTLNRMTVTQVAAGGEIHAVAETQSAFPDVLRETIEFGLLASPPNPFDPMDKAVRDLGGRARAASGQEREDRTPVREYPLSEKRPLMALAWQPPGGTETVIAAKGAPEAIAGLCRMTGVERLSMDRLVDEMAGRGLRILGVAGASHEASALPEDPAALGFRFLGLLGLEDPVRPGVAEAVAQCRAAGIRVLMITGDYPVTALQIAGRIGLQPCDRVITGPELDGLDDNALAERIRTTSVFARAVPEHKLRIVQALKANGEVAAMTGDGVNDAPALKAAHIGIAMGGRGTDVARESAALVLLDDNFASIVQAVRMGRRIFDNLKKAMTFIFSVHIPIAGMALLPVLLGWPLAFLPIHIVFLELIIDPACSVVFEMERDEGDIMDRPPRPLNEPLFGRLMILTGLVQGAAVLVIVAAIFGFALLRGLGEAEARLMSFSALVLANLGLILANRSWKRSFLVSMRSPNPAVWWVAGGALFFLALNMAVPFLRELFRFGVPHLWEIVLVVSAGLISLLVSDRIKTIMHRRLS